MIHDRDAHEDVLRILAADGPPEHVIFHCFSGDAAMAKRCAEAGYVMSFAGNVTFSSAQPLRDAAAAAPADLILVETDAPVLNPGPAERAGDGGAHRASDRRGEADGRGGTVRRPDRDRRARVRAMGPLNPRQLR